MGAGSARRRSTPMKAGDLVVVNYDCFCRSSDHFFVRGEHGVIVHIAPRSSYCDIFFPSVSGIQHFLKSNIELALSDESPTDER